ncbi:MAG: MBL fold metallo-hydrolase [Bacteroidetes bacterium]|nr:MBL fold metallo-hydrolase [Bacteroidota bacterium]
MKIHPCSYILFLLLFTCQGFTNALKSQPILNKDTVLNLSKDVNDSITIHYIGCSGFFIKKGKSAVLIDPYFSYTNANTYFSGALTNKSNIPVDLKNLIESVFLHVIGDSLDRSGSIKTLLITHGHYDHYGDVPYLYHSGHLNKDTIKIIGNNTVQGYLGEVQIADRNIIKPVESSVSTPSIEGKWIYVDPKIRILPVLTEHAPNLKILGININFVPKNHEQENTRHKYWREYAMGQTLCYLIDFLNDDGSINFRTYINSAASNFPYGFPAQVILNQHPVDVTLLCVASFNNVKNYPEDIVKYLKPKHIIACHWEDFLNSSIPELKKKPKTVPGTNVAVFFKRLDKVLSDLNSGISFTLPNVNTTIKFFYSNKKLEK